VYIGLLKQLRHNTTVATVTLPWHDTRHHFIWF